MHTCNLNLINSSGKYGVRVMVFIFNNISVILWRLVLLEDTGVLREIRVITKLPNSEQPYKGKVKTHKYINRQNQSSSTPSLSVIRTHNVSGDMH